MILSAIFNTNGNEFENTSLKVSQYILDNVAEWADTQNTAKVHRSTGWKNKEPPTPQKNHNQITTKPPPNNNKGIFKLKRKRILQMPKIKKFKVGADAMRAPRKREKTTFQVWYTPSEMEVSGGGRIT